MGPILRDCASDRVSADGVGGKGGREAQACEQHNAPNSLTAEHRAGATLIPKEACSSGIAVQHQWGESRACIRRWHRGTSCCKRIANR